MAHMETAVDTTVQRPVLSLFVTNSVTTVPVMVGVDWGTKGSLVS